MKKIVWSIDAFQDDPTLNKQAVDVVRNLAEKSRCKVQPVYILSPDQLNVSMEFSPPWVEQYRPAAEKALEQTLKNVKIPNLLKAKVVVQKIPSLRHGVQALSNFAVSEGADLIVVGTHARAGLPRFFLGSFTESLLLLSKVPILTVNPGTSIRKLDHILYSTDFSKQSRTAYKRVIDLAAALGAKITVFNHVQNPIEPIVQSGVYLLGGGWVSVNAYMEEETESLTKLAEEMADEARDKGVKADVYIDSGREGVTQSVVDYAEKKKVSIIAMAGQSGPVAATLVGSIARQVVRSAPCPTWVIHTAAKKKTSK